MAAYGSQKKWHPMYDIREIVGFWTQLDAPAAIGPTDLANMHTLLGRLHKYIG
jgi:hypothetical protein